MLWLNILCKLAESKYTNKMLRVTVQLKLLKPTEALILNRILSHHFL